MGQRHKQAAGLEEFIRSDLCPEPRPSPKVKKASTSITLLCGDPRAAVRNASWLPAASPGRAPDPPMPWHLGNVGRQEVWKQTRENRIHIREHVYEEGKKMCVNCMMKCKPLVLNEKSESGPSQQKAWEFQVFVENSWRK